MAGGPLKQSRPRPKAPSQEVSVPRTAALEILEQAGRGRRLDVAFLDVVPGDSPDRAWIRELVYGTVRLRGRIDHVLARWVKKGLPSLDSAVLDVLRLAAYQILFMDGVPSYAAVSQAVSQARRRSGHGAGGLVNAVLRRVVESGLDPEAFPDPGDRLVDYLVSWGSHPRWMVERWVEAFGEEGATRLVESNNQVPGVFLRPLGCTPDQACDLLAESGLEGTVVEGSPVVRLAPGVSPARALDLLPSVIQDPASAWVPQFAEPPVDGLTLDLCSAPGGKALAMASLGGHVVACDLSETRLALVKQGAQRLSLDLPLVVARGEAPPFRTAELVFVDAPCSGTGTLRRHPDGKWRLRPGDIKALVEIQRSILDAAVRMVPPGGRLVYATCALEPEENQGQVEWVLDRFRDLALEPGPVPEDLLNAEGCLEIRPQDTGFDGAFAARFRRMGSST